MQIIGLVCVRNERDIIEPFVRHTLTYCDRLLVMDHGSTDATPEILLHLQQEGLAVHVYRDDSIGHIQSEQMNRLLHLAANDFGADWILCLDVDEFLTGCPDRSFLPRPVDERTPCLKLGVRTYYTHRDDDPAEVNPVVRITHRLIEEPSPINCNGISEYKVIIPGPLARKPNVHLAQGNHLFHRDGAEAPFRVITEAWLAHFSLRSPAQYGVKLVGKYLQSLRHVSPRGDASAFYRKAYAGMMESYSAFAENFHSVRISYHAPHDRDAVVRDPIDYRGGPLRHTPSATDSDEFIRQVLTQAEILAHPTGEKDAGPTSVPLSIGVSSSAAQGTGETRVIEADPSVKKNVTFVLDANSRDIFLRFHSEPGMLEVRKLTLVYPGTPPVKWTPDETELQEKLQVICDAVALPSQQACRILISREPAVLALHDCRDARGATPTELCMEIHFENRLREHVILDPLVLNSINRDRQRLAFLESTVGSMLENATVSLDSPMGFNTGGKAFLFMRDGWCAPEDWGTWTLGEEAILKLRFPAAPARDLLLVAELKALPSGPHGAVDVTVRIDGTKVARWQVGKDRFHPFTARIPAALVQSTECVVSFKIANPRSPAAFGIGDDTRSLGVGFQRITFQEQRRRGIRALLHRW